MNKSTFSIILSILAIIIAGISAFSFELDLESYSFALGTLTLLVTLLVGWQIYTKIEVDNKVKKEINTQVTIGADTALFVSLAQLGRSSYNKGDNADAIQTFLNALCIWKKEMTSPLAKEAYDYCVGILKLLSTQNTIFEVEKAEEKDAFVKAVLKTGDREIIDFVMGIKVRNK